MKSFTILITEESFEQEETVHVLRVFADFYYNLTPSHRKRVKLIFVERNGLLNAVFRKAKKYKVRQAIQIVQDSSEVYNQVSLAWIPKVIDKQKEAMFFLKKGIPVVSYKSRVLNSLVDITCGILIDSSSKESSINLFSDIFHALYFDPIVRSILKEGTYRKFSEKHRVTLED